MSPLKIYFLLLSTMTIGYLSYQPETPQSIPPPEQFTYSDAIGPEAGITRRDPSDVIRVDGLYYVWYTKVWDTQEGYPSGYPGSIAYATSPDGLTWSEQGVCLEPGPDDAWDGHGVFTPNILVADNKYYMFYTAVPQPFDVPYTKGVTPTAIGIATANHPEGPWSRLDSNPVLRPESEDPTYFDSFRVDDASLIVRDGKYWMYYKGRALQQGTQFTKMGVAIADQPTGPYRKQKQYGDLHAGHEVLVWPTSNGVVSMATASGPRALYVAPDGFHFEKQLGLKNSPRAPGVYRSDRFGNNAVVQDTLWGISHASQKDGEGPATQLYLKRFTFTPQE